MVKCFEVTGEVPPGDDLGLVAEGHYSAYSTKIEFAKYLMTEKSRFTKDYNRKTCTSNDLSQYELIRTIGKGAFGTVFLAKSKKHSSYLVIKCLKKADIIGRNLLHQVLNEKRIMSNIKFNFVLNITETFIDNSFVYFAMPYLCGGDLLGHLSREKRFDERVTKFYVAQVILALEYLHNLKIAHRDLKPENLSLDHRGYLRLLDFGLSKIVLTKTYTFCGTPEYMAPEIILGKGYGFSVDWWSLGVVAYLLSSGIQPFFSSKQDRLFSLITNCDFKDREFFSNDLSDLLCKLICVDVTNRVGCGLGVTLGRELNIKCPLDGEYKHGLPETNCLRYYVCKGSNSVERHTCPAGTHYSPTSKDCRASGSCYNVVCAGRVDGRYADTTEQCTRWFECSGGAVETIESCPLGYHFNELNNSCVSAGAVVCPKPKFSSSLVVKITNPCHGHPDGYFPVRESTIYVKCINQVEVETLSCPSGQKFDGWSCTHQHTDDACSFKSDGYHIEDTDHCTAYVLCKDRQIVLKSKCPSGTSFNGRTCEPQRLHSCASKNDRECRGLPTGYYPNVENKCKSYFHCVDDILVKEVHCPQGSLWDGLHCSPQGYFKCEEYRTDECTGKRGYIADVSSKCQKYYYCSHGTKMTFHCPLGQIFNGVKCVSNNDHVCPAKNENSCDGKSSGYYTDTESNCRSYYYCANGHKIVYVCPPKQVFDGTECVANERFECPTLTNTECADRSNGYQKLQRSLRDYIYCSNGVKLITLQCKPNEVYDGEKCVNVDQYKSMCHNVRFGHITDKSCRVYYLCRDEYVINSGVCLSKFVFDGNSCVPHSQERCDRGSIKSCSGAPNGFYADFNTDCQQYFYCINGQKTQLSCPSGQVHNGDICVPINQYTCPSLAANIT